MQPDQHHTTTSRHNLPTSRTSFIGRERATAEVKRLLGDARVLSLVGAGGSGKTRLALRVAEETLDDFPDGVGWIDLAALTDPELLPQAVTRVLGLREQPNRSLVDLL